MIRVHVLVRRPRRRDVVIGCIVVTHRAVPTALALGGLFVVVEQRLRREPHARVLPYTLARAHQSNCSDRCTHK